MRELLGQVTFRGVLRERSVEPFVRMLRRLRGLKRLKGVLLEISSGGGEVVASQDLYLAVARLNERVPVVASIGAVGASGAYLAALGSRKVFAYPESQVGSIGVIYPHVAVRELVRRLGISLDLIHVGAHKDAFQGYRPLTDVERAKVQELAQEDYDRFVELVARARHRTVEEIRSLATGEVWSGRRALALGLVDALGDREIALEELSRLTGVATRRAVRMEPPRPFFERMFASGAGAFTSGVSAQLHEMVEEALLDLRPPRVR